MASPDPFTTMTNILYAVRIETNLDFGSIVEAGLELLNEEMIVVRHVDDDVAHLEAYYQDRTAAEEQEQRLREKTSGNSTSSAFPTVTGRNSGSHFFTLSALRRGS